MRSVNQILLMVFFVYGIISHAGNWCITFAEEVPERFRNTNFYLWFINKTLLISQMKNENLFSSHVPNNANHRTLGSYACVSAIHWYICILMVELFTPPLLEWVIFLFLAKLCLHPRNAAETELHSTVSAF